MAIMSQPAWAKYFPESAAKSLALASLIAGAVGMLDVLLVTWVAKDYGYALFLGTPCLMGVLAPILHGIGAPRSFWQLLAAAILCQVALFAGMVVFAIEGIVCILMATPIWLSLAAIGATIAWPIHRAMWSGHVVTRGFPVAVLLLAGMLPLLAGAERRLLPDPQFTLSTTVEIDAPPEIVWRNLLAYSDMPTPDYWPFHVGMAVPLRAELPQAGLGGTRYCVFSTGSAAEHITEWDEPRRLAFDVLNTPPPMREWTLYTTVPPPHLDGYLQSNAAHFELETLPGGRTRITGTSLYTNRMFPVAYWRLWSDAIIKDVHLAVFAHVKQISEAEAHRTETVAR